MPESIREAEATPGQGGLPPVLMVDCSHANSGKQPARQEDVWRSVIEQRVGGTRSLVGVMIESYLRGGQPADSRRRSELRYGVSITDACMSLGDHRADAALGLRDAGQRGPLTAHAEAWPGL